MSKENSNRLPVFFNRNQLAGALGVSVRRLYEAKLPPSALDAVGKPLFAHSRLDALAMLLKKPEVIA